MAKSNGPDLTHLQDCIDDTTAGFLDGDSGPADPTNYHELLGRLIPAREKFPPLYQTDFVDPFTHKLREMGDGKFNQVLVHDPQRVRGAGLMLDLSQAVLQRGDSYELNPTNAFQQLVDDLYDGFLSAEDRKGVAPPENATDAPLIKWGNPASGPYTWPIDACRSFNVAAAVVNLPPSHARRALLGWGALGHETAGHDVLHAYAGLEDQLAVAVRNALQKTFPGTSVLPDYWADRIDETASDVMGILNMGPAAAIGVIGYFRGLNAALGNGSKLSNEGPANDEHPADIVRGYLAAETVRQLSFKGATAWAKSLTEQTEADVTGITLVGHKVTKADAEKSAQIVAETIVTTPLPTLEGHTLGSIQDWRDADEAIVTSVIKKLPTMADVPTTGTPRIYASHVVAAAILAALETGNIPTLFTRMLNVLDVMHKANPSWGPLFVRHPGNMVRHFAYRRVTVHDLGQKTGLRAAAEIGDI
jgi:hypothetical protein